MWKAIVIALGLFAVCLAAQPVLDASVAGGAVGIYRFLGGEAAQVHPSRPDTVVTRVEGHPAEERLGWRDAGGYYVLFCLAVLGACWPLDRRYALKFLGVMAAAFGTWLALMGAFLGLACARSFLAPVLAPHPFVLPGAAVAVVFCLVTRLRRPVWLACAAATTLVALMVTMGYEAPLVVMMILFPLVHPAVSTGTSSRGCIQSKQCPIPAEGEGVGEAQQLGCIRSIQETLVTESRGDQ